MKKSILIVDDESINISLLIEILSESYNILVATDGRSALELIHSTQSVDLILLDIVMPEMDGYEVSRHLKSDERTSVIPFIFLTAKNDSQSIVKGFNEGAVDYISKPFAREELLARVHNHIQLDTLKKSLIDALSTLNAKVNEIDRVNEELYKNKTFLQSILEHSTHAIVVTDIHGIITLFNRAAELMLGYESIELINKHSPEIFHDRDEVLQRAEEFSKQLREDIKVGFDVFIAKSKRGLPNSHEWKYITKDKSSISVNLSINTLKDDRGDINGYIGIIEDITQKREDERKIKTYVELVNKNIITSSTDLKGTITYTSEAFCKISGFTQEELLGKSHRIIRHPDMDKSLYDDLWSTISANKEWKGILKNRTKNGAHYWVDTVIYPIYDAQGKKSGYTAIRQDITDKKRVEELSVRDELSSLYNRRYFNEILSQELNRAKRENIHILFIMLDVDHFKAYNDSYGHQEGDHVLSKIGKVMHSFSRRAGDFSFRLGGEEFGIISSKKSLQEAIDFADNLKEAIEALKIPHRENSASEFVTVSMGLVYKKVDKDTTEKSLYKEADMNLYKAKEKGRNRVVST